MGVKSLDYDYISKYGKGLTLHILVNVTIPCNAIMSNPK